MENLLVRTLGRFKKCDIPKICEKWGPLRGSGIEQRCDAKASFIREAIQICKKKKITTDTIHVLDLIRTQIYSNTRQWIVADLVDIQPRTTAWTTSTMRKALLAEMKLSYREVEVSVLQDDGLFWIRIAYAQSKRRATPNLTYVVASIKQKKATILTSNLKASLAENFLQVFLEVLDANQCHELSLRGKCVKSLLKLVHFKECEDVGRQWKNTRAPKRKADEIDDTSDDIVYENQAEKRRRLDYVHDVYGAEELPNLEKVEYRMETNFRGLKYAPGMAQKPGYFNCSVKFEGTSVINGIRELTSSGLATVPMKRHLQMMHLKGRSSFLLRERDANQSQRNNASRNVTVDITQAS